MQNGANSVHKLLRTELEDYIKSQYFGKSPLLLSALSNHIDDEGLLYQKPFIESSPAYVTVPNGINTASIEPWMKEYFLQLAQAGIGVFPSPFAHQISALEAATKGENLFVSTGTGSGKTSVVNLIPRLYDATRGTVYVDGQDVKTYDPKQLRSKVGIVPQKAVLFAGTIRENLMWGNENATEEQLERALEISQAKEFVDTKEGRLDFKIAQGGKNLSGGQRQRMTIARAVVRDPEILILDDSASALDFATDAKLRHAIREMGNDMVVIIVSQRSSSIQYADQIIVLDDGKVVGIGTHDSLLAENEVYQEIYYSQFPKEAAGNEK